MNVTMSNLYAGKSRYVRRTKKRHMKPMNCSPAVKKISVHNSCYTPKILFMIRDAYNKDHHNQEDKIEETDPTKLWQVLNSRFV